MSLSLSNQAIFEAKNTIEQDLLNPSVRAALSNGAVVQKKREMVLLDQHQMCSGELTSKVSLGIDGLDSKKLEHDLGAQLSMMR